jgi:uncharacterized membrane protein
MILQILILIALVLYIIFSSINVMEQYSEEAKENFKSDRNWKIAIAIIIFIVLYFTGNFNLLF